MASPGSIIVIGAGVIGLSTATLLQSHYPHATITIIAAELPNTSSPSADYASMWAGAHYRPIPQSTAQLKDEAHLAFRTAEVMKDIAKQFPDAGVECILGVELFENPGEDVMSLKTGDIYAGAGDEFRVMQKVELPRGVTWGCEYQTYCVNVKIYCRWLLGRFVSKGGKIVEHRLSSAFETFEFAQQRGLGNVKTVVNCSGRNFDQDPMMKIIRGQTVLVKQQYNKTITRQNQDGSWTFVIPRPQGGGTIIGGTKEIGDFEPCARPDTRDRLLQKCVEAYPDFVDTVDKFEVVHDNVGRRPWREGGIRTHIDNVEPGRRIVHCYGTGGRGYELSWGVAERAVQALQSSLTIEARL